MKRDRHFPLTLQTLCQHKGHEIRVPVGTKGIVLEETAEVGLAPRRGRAGRIGRAVGYAGVNVAHAARVGEEVAAAEGCVVAEASVVDG